MCLWRTVVVSCHLFVFTAVLHMTHIPELRDILSVTSHTRLYNVSCRPTLNIRPCYVRAMTTPLLTKWNISAILKVMKILNSEGLCIFIVTVTDVLKAYHPLIWSLHYYYSGCNAPKIGKSCGSFFFAIPFFFLIVRLFPGSGAPVTASVMNGSGGEVSRVWGT